MHVPTSVFGTSEKVVYHVFLLMSLKFKFGLGRTFTWTALACSYTNSILWCLIESVAFFILVDFFEEISWTRLNYFPSMALVKTFQVLLVHVSYICLSCLSYRIHLSNTFLLGFRNLFLYNSVAVQNSNCIMVCCAILGSDEQYISAVLPHINSCTNFIL